MDEYFLKNNEVHILATKMSLEGGNNPLLFPSTAYFAGAPGVTFDLLAERKRRKIDGGTPYQRNTVSQSGMDFSISDHPGAGEIANHMRTHQICMRAYVDPIKGATSWSSTLPEGHLVFTRHIDASNGARWSNFPYPVNGLTLAHLNYIFQSKMRAAVDEIEADPAFLRIAAGPAREVEYHRLMLERYREMMNEASEWRWAGVSQTRLDYAFNPATETRDRVIVVQASGPCFVDNVWDDKMSVPTTLWIRLAGHWESGLEATMYKFGDTETAIVQGTLTRRGFMMPRFEAVSCDYGINLSEDVVMFREYTEPIVSNNTSKKSYFLESAILYKIGYCFSPTGEVRPRRGYAPPKAIHSFRKAGAYTQVQALLTG